MVPRSTVVTRVLLSALLCTGIGTGSGWAQNLTGADKSTKSGSAPEFDVSTVKVNNTGSGSSRLSIRDDTLLATNMPINSLMEAAYDIRRDQIIGLPRWAEDGRYDVVAKMVDFDPQLMKGLSHEQREAMLQHLLEQRFHLQTHKEKRTLPLLNLVVVKDGIKFSEWQKPAEGEPDNAGRVSARNDDLTATGVTMQALIRFLSGQTHMPIVDETGLTGKYNFHLKWQRAEEGQQSGLHDESLPDIYAALPEQLGLKLESGKGPVEVLVVDHIEPPVEN